MLKIKSLAIIYSLSSIVLGPSIVFYALGRGKVGMDCSDSTWTAVGETTKNIYYNQASLIMIISSVVMLLLGGIILYLLRKQPKIKTNIILAFIVGIMMCGYVLILVNANTWNC